VGGILQNFIWLDDDEQRLEAAHHEASHALRAHDFGVTVESVCLNLNPVTGTYVQLSGDPSEHPMWEHAQIGLAGPIASAKYCREHSDLIVFREHHRSIGLSEDDADLLEVIDSIRWVSQDRDVRCYDELTPEYFVECDLTGFLGLDDFQRTFDALLTEQYNKYGRIPRKSTLLKRYREHEKIARDWVETNWSKITKIACATLKEEKNTMRYTHRLSKSKFYKLVKNL
jgi:hypothetical protein